MNKIIRKILTAVISASVVCSMAVGISAANGSKTETFSGVKLGSYEMSGELTGCLTGGYATTRCNKSVYYIAANVTGYVMGENEHGIIQRYDLGEAPLHKYNNTMVYTFIGGHEPIGVETGSFWSAHEIRDGVNGVGHYLATIDV